MRAKSKDLRSTTMISPKRISFFSFAILLTVMFAASYVPAQQPPLAIKPIRPSQKASVMQTIGVTDITITYSRPAVKGRTIFAEPPASMAERAKGEATLDNQNERKPGEPIVPYNHVWRAGANEATMFVVTDDVLINGQPLKAGTYSLHTVPGKDEWTIVFNNDAGQWGSFTYDDKKDALRVKTKPQAVSDNQELLSFNFDPVSENSATVNIRWEKVRVPFTVEVKDVKALWRAKADALIAANPTNEVLPLQVANVYVNDKNFTEALKFVDQSIKVKQTFRNLSAKARILYAAGRKDEAFKVADEAIAQGKADKVDTAAFEKQLANMKAGKM
jgi:tetratricopeptide (TPR) repeat protein